MNGLLVELLLIVALLGSLPLCTGAERAEPAVPAVAPLKQAHAHNDYLHKRPLLDALDQGFTSVEADIFLVDGRLLVAHTARELKPERTLEALYLDPLLARVKSNSGSVYPGGGRFTLLIDLKNTGEKTYVALSQTLAKYAEMLSVVRDGKLTPGAVTVVISGDRPVQVLKNESVRYAGYDGRMGDLDSDEPAELMPMISDNWFTNFKWRGTGPISDAEKAKLDDAVAKAHSRGRLIRFWAIPDRPEAWQVMQQAGVDLINTDNLPGLATYLRGQAK